MREASGKSVTFEMLSTVEDDGDSFAAGHIVASLGEKNSIGMQHDEVKGWIGAAFLLLVNQTTLQPTRASTSTRVRMERSSPASERGSASG